MGDIAAELVVKINHMQEKAELGPLADLLLSLREHDFDAKRLASSGLSKLVYKLRKHEDERVKKAAAEAVDRWKAAFVPGDAAPKSNPAAGKAAASTAPSASAAASAAASSAPKLDRPPPSASTQISATSADAGVRTSAQQKLAEVFNKVVAGPEQYRLSADELEGVDPAALAAEIESTMHDRLGGATTAYKNKLRSLLFNLKDSKNTELVTRVLCGSITAEKLVVMDPKEMASSETKKWREQISEYKKMELMDQQSYQRYAYKDRELPDGLFECPKCRSKKTEYSEKQTRSADEPTTKFCHCCGCDYRWKFC